MKKFVRQQGFPFSARVAIMILCIVAEMAFSSCSSCSHHEEQAQEQSPQAYEYNSSFTNNYDNGNVPSSSSSMTPEETRSALNSASVMSREEDAYEESHALHEEDRLNGTRQHEGDNYDDDYDDDYDDGYDE